MSAAWRAFADEVARWQDSGRELEFWWRDDDACRDHPALQRLLELVVAAGVPLGLAVVPGDAEAGLFANFPSSITVLQHGCDHRNRAQAGGKKTEFPEDEPVDAALARLGAARRRLQAVTGSRVLPVLVPPWNRIGASLASRLSGAGYAGLSCYGAIAGPQVVPGLRQVNTHLDIIDWRGGRVFAGAERVLLQATRHLAARRQGGVTPGGAASGGVTTGGVASVAAGQAVEPTGWLTHHLVHDEAAWVFLARLFEVTRDLPGVRWRHAAGLFTAG